MNPVYVPPPPPYSGPSAAGPSAPPAWMGPGMPGKWDWGTARVQVQKGVWGLGLWVVLRAWRGVGKLLLQELKVILIYYLR